MLAFFHLQSFQQANPLERLQECGLLGFRGSEKDIQPGLEQDSVKYQAKNLAFFCKGWHRLNKRETEISVIRTHLVGIQKISLESAQNQIKSIFMHDSSTA